MLAVPAFILVDFWVERERVEQELCVQRLVSEEVRTCHGQCYLMKQLNKAEQRAQDLPGQLRAWKLGDMAVHAVEPGSEQVADHHPAPWPRLMMDPLTGHRPASDPVPWC